MCKCNGCCLDANGLVVRLTNLMDAYEASLVAARLERYDLLSHGHSNGTVGILFSGDL